MKAPWDFSEEPAPESAVPNLPTPEGRELGAQVARLVDIEAAKQREQFPKMPPGCNECAGTAGTLPNGCAETLMDLIKCATEGVPFWCHKGIGEGEAPRALCRAWVVLQGGDLAGIVKRAQEKAERDAKLPCIVKLPARQDGGSRG